MEPLDAIADARFHDTALFFLTELYGAADTSKRDADVARVVPITVKLLPLSGLETVADAVDLDTLSEILDADMADALGERADDIDASAYGAAYRAIGRREERERQLELIEHIGHALDRLTHHHFAGAALTMMRKPARLAGFGDLQTFLEDGYRAFRKMGGADEFLGIIVSRERAVMEGIYAGDDTVLDRTWKH